MFRAYQVQALIGVGVLLTAFAGTAYLAGWRVDVSGVACRIDRGRGHPVAATASGGGDQVVPRRLADVLPNDLDALDSVAARKRAFVRIVLPLALKANEDIAADRRFARRAIACGHVGKRLDAAAHQRLNRLFESYDAANAEVLLRRLDTVPPSLVLAQGAIESGWGTSRFARQGNALFGQRTSNAGQGLKPHGLDADTPVRVAAFPHLLASVRAYIHNLNTHAVYRSFRERRAALRKAGRPVDGSALAGTLVRYSERGGDYVRDLKDIIRHNAFDVLDDTHLEAAARSQDMQGSS